ncbi:NAD(P)H-dependent oxidoreductase subunit E [Pelagicoccus sp. SDUM812003]|uniref:NADH-quinone oxidoreductase subunit NuoE family protein n=1 Tax=Pelagicoccus sp. SDUM812003 TaxID=3041267 RepID=UPI00280E6248|nr:NAD(P)H-dependent oxidoreductase subunit E [Pelagicoccus sp. SDUM812003]MDQ8202646.1 NAD(P)H-dependent oxidoreductase subunit E [Pelagicoccus sp. SDUM812003]
MNLKPETLAEIEAAIPKYPDPRSAVMPLLHAIQKDQGLLTNEAAEWVAKKLGIEPINVLSVITFYPFFRQHKIGKRHIRVCRTLSCAMAGGAKVCDTMLKEFETELNEVSPDGEVTVEFAECLASCGSAPVMLVDEELHENLDVAKAKALCEKIKAEAKA